MAAWPNPNEYAEALQNPRAAFKDADLVKTQVSTNKLGLPRPISGNFATVFEVTGGGQRWAVRCFLREVTTQQQRYAAISAHLQQNPLACIVPFVYLEEGIRVRGKWYPILKMQWATETRLDTYIEDHLDEPATLARLAEQWFDLCGVLRRAHMVHGDFQHGNIVVGAGEAIKLLDYDGMLVPGAIELPSGEIGHRHYQHPSRSSNRGLTASNYQNVDNFSAHVIGLSLQALASDPSLWRKTGAGEENLLFRDTDYQSPENSTALHVLRDHVDPRVRQIGQRMGQLAQTTSYLDVPPLEPVVVTPWTTRVSSRLKTALTPPPTPDVVVPLTPLSAPTKPSAWWSDHLERPVVDFDSLQVDAEVQRIRAEFERSVLRYFPMLFRDYTAMRLMQSYPNFDVVRDKSTLEQREKALNDQLILAKARFKRTQDSIDEARRQHADECAALSFAVEQMTNAIQSTYPQEEAEVKAFERRLGLVEDQLTRQPIDAEHITGFTRAHIELLAQVGVLTAADVRPANEAQAKYMLSGFRKAAPDHDWEQLVRWRVALERALLSASGESPAWASADQVRRYYADQRSSMTRVRADRVAQLEAVQTESAHLRQIAQLTSELQFIDGDINALIGKLTALRADLKRYEHITLRNLLKRVLN
ncbi:MAG: hypothetical protein IPO91_07070 [Chloroflexi bacterium]|nr:hypothetical protein [Chloroflexota bacterium]